MATTINPVRVAEAMVEGYTEGLNWPDGWARPGGPYASRNDAEAVAKKKAWCEGWEIGYAEMGRKAL